jgi:D-alanyl-D-alanine carboxypeptidase (penicillin-binding protein 5/6)
MANTRYTDPAGWDAGTVSTADDQIRLAELALTIPAFAQIVATPQGKVPMAGLVHNRNSLLGTDGIDGVKTGSMDSAGGNLVFTAATTVDGKPVRLIGAVLNQAKGLPQAFTETQRLIVAARAAIRLYTVIKAGQIVAETSDHTPLRAATDLAVLGWPGLRYRASLNVPTDQAISHGSTVGVLALSSGGTTVTVNLIAD